MTLTDAGPLVGLVDENDPYHSVCSAATKQLPREPLLTSWPCLTEAMYLLYRACGFSGQSALWKMLAGGRLVLHDLSGAEIDRMSALMGKYQDRPMDMADASLIAIAETLGLTKVFTLDRDFYIYRLANGKSLEVVP